MMKRGQTLDVFVELDYASRSEMPRDFSVVAWGQNGKKKGRIHLTHNDGLESASFPELPLDPQFDDI
jgi:aminoglycoside N3'-acetyltransferase